MGVMGEHGAPLRQRSSSKQDAVGRLRHNGQVTWIDATRSAPTRSRSRLTMFLYLHTQPPPRSLRAFAQFYPEHCEPQDIEHI